MRVLVTDKIDGEALELLRSRDIEVDERIGADGETMRESISKADGWIVRSGTQVTANLLSGAARLKVIGRAGVGVDNIDVGAATRQGIAVLNTPTGNTMAAVEHSIALLLALARHIPMAHASLVTEGRWDRAQFTGVELYGKTMGILGLGKIGARVAARCRGLEMQVLAYDPFLAADRARSLGIELTTDLDDLLGRCDFISLHLPATPDTTNLINADRLARTKRGVRIINCARGSLIDEQALTDALWEGQVAGAALDVFKHEPPTDSPLLKAPNVVATPHLGASTIESQRNVGMQIAEQVAEALEHGIFREAVNLAVRDWAKFAKLSPQLLLVQRLGIAAQQYLGSGISRIEVEYCGEGFEELAALNNMLLAGVLHPVLGESVNAVNSPLLAHERGIELICTERDRSINYRSLIRVRVEAEGREGVLAGTTFDDQEPRLVEIDGYSVELLLIGVLLVFHNFDRPGVIGDVGSVLGSHNINVAHFSLGRKEPGREALGVVAVDELIPPVVLEELAGLKNMKWINQIVIDL